MRITLITSLLNRNSGAHAPARAESSTDHEAETEGDTKWE
jgi:hypothetical protein